MNDFSVAAVLVAALGFFALGSLWYSVLFGKPWRAEMGVSEDDVQAPAPLLLVASAVVALVISFTLAQLIGGGGAGYGIRVGAGVGAGIGAASLAQNYLYESRTVRLFAINASYLVVGLALAGLLIGIIQD